jgi:hypothetical protein
MMRESCGWTLLTFLTASLTVGLAWSSRTLRGMTWMFCGIRSTGVSVFVADPAVSAR